MNRSVSDYTQISCEIAEGIATITLDRPDALNAFTATMMRELLDVFDRIDSDDEVRAVIVTGRGRGFCAGADLSGGGGTFDATERGTAEADPPDVPRDGGGLVSLRAFECTNPVIAAI